MTVSTNTAVLMLPKKRINQWQCRREQGITGQHKRCLRSRMHIVVAGHLPLLLAIPTCPQLDDRRAPKRRA
eukprot:scaffold212291_cov29-Tisochrysis_lutea.AAC.4